MTDETRETCRKLLDRIFRQEMEPMFTPPPPWQNQTGLPPVQTNDRIGVMTPQTMTMRKFCHYMFQNHQDELLGIIQANRELRKKAHDAPHPYIYRRTHDESAVAALNKLATSKNITIIGSHEQQVSSYGEYRAEHLNYKSCAKKPKHNKMNIPGVVIGDVSDKSIGADMPKKPDDVPVADEDFLNELRNMDKDDTRKAISSFVSHSKLKETIAIATKLSKLDAEKQPLVEECGMAEAKYIDLSRQIKKIEQEQRELARQLSSIGG